MNLSTDIQERVENLIGMELPRSPVMAEEILYQALQVLERNNIDDEVEYQIVQNYHVSLLKLLCGNRLDCSFIPLAPEQLQ